MNLQVHLTGHLGVKVNIHRCAGCRRNFRNKTELDLHMRSHIAAKLLEKSKNISKGLFSVKNKAKPKVITTSGATDKKIIRKYIKSTAPKIFKPEFIKKKSVTVNANKSDLTCAMCDKSFGVQSLYLRHVKKFHPDLSETLDSHIQLKALPSINIKKCLLPKSPTKVPNTSTSPRIPKSPMRKVSTPCTPASGKASKKERSKCESLTPVLPDYYNTLECPDCSRVFVAKSIFERHLQSAKHGIYGQVSTSRDTDSSLSPQVPPTPHWTQSPLPPATEGGSPHKIECHLCNQTFIRVKDLAKHREKICQAYHA